MPPSVSVPSAADLVVPVSRWTDDDLRERVRHTRRRLLLAAADLFDTHGYRGAALSDILAAAGLTKGALYFHFRSKRALAEALMAEVERSWAALVAEIAGRDLDPLWRLLVETDAYSARWMWDPLVRGATRAINDPELRPLRRAWMETWENATVDLLEQARTADLLADGVDARRAARAVVVVAAGNYGLADDPQDLWDRMVDSWLDVVPLVAHPRWCEAWRSSVWHGRPTPLEAPYRLARQP